MKNSQYLKCPLTPQFFRKLGKNHSSQIRRVLLSEWGFNSKEYEQVIRDRLKKFGHIESTLEQTNDWHEAFKFSKARNKYDGYNRDRSRMNEEVTINNILVYKGIISVDEATWLTLASLAFQKDIAKESPNHFYLKELLRLYMYRQSIDFIAEEMVSDIHGYPVRYDIVFSYPMDIGDMRDIEDTADTVYLSHITDSVNNEIRDTMERYTIGEVGDTELWKVMGTLYQGNQCIIVPHWTWQRTNPFITKKLHYHYYLFRRKGSGIK